KEYSDKAQYIDAMASVMERFDKNDFVEPLLHFRKAQDYAPEDSTASAMSAQCNRKIQESKDAQNLVRELLKQSIDLYDARRYVEALAGFDEALNIDPGNEFADELRERCAANISRIVAEHRRRAQRAAEVEDYSLAIRELNNLAVYGALDDDVQREIDTLSEKQKTVQTESEKQSRQAGTAEQTANVSAISEQMLKEMDRKYAEAMRSFKVGDFDAAIRDFRDVWAIDPEYHAVSDLLTKAYLLKGMRLYGQERYDAAAASWRLALNVEPDNEKVKRYLEKISEELQKMRGDGRG
ncbi:MAG: hypothetical protein R3284_10425, partial [Rubricoccaceae bacterium]|nr:hypothetical protein [Rubricoccaceae bacterium]